MRVALSAVCVALSLCLIPTDAKADETGFADMHTQRREGRKLCHSDHWHYGNGSGKTKALALRAAIQSWASFTAFEYGSTWANWNKASGKSVSYSGSGSTISADISARACK